MPRRLLFLRLGFEFDEPDENVLEEKGRVSSDVFTGPSEQRPGHAHSDYILVILVVSS